MKEHAEGNWKKVLANLKNLLENQFVNSIKIQNEGAIESQIKIQ